MAKRPEAMLASCCEVSRASEGVVHGYMIPGAPMHNKEACERSRKRTFDLFRRTLQEAPATAPVQPR